MRRSTSEGRVVTSSASSRDADAHGILKEAFSAKERKCVALVEQQQRMDEEIHELTATLFLEAGKIITEADHKRVRAEKRLEESQLQIDLLSAEVKALKTVVKTCSPSKKLSKSIQHLAQLPASLPQKGSMLSPVKSPKRSLFSPLRIIKSGKLLPQQLPSPPSTTVIIADANKDMDEALYQEINDWRNKADYSLEPADSTFFTRILDEDITPCLAFKYSDVSATKLLDAIKRNAIEIEPLTARREENRGECALLGVKVLCTHHLRLSMDDEWLILSTMARNRIVAVCDLFTYVGYLRSGMIRPTAKDLYWKLVELRKNIALARLGLPFSSEFD